MLRTVVALMVAALLVSCGGETKELAQSINTIKDIAGSTDQIETSTNALEKRRQERKANGDTLAIPADKLAEMLPNTINGFTAQEAEKQSLEVPGMSYTQASRQYTSNDATITATIADYNSSEAGFGLQTMLFSVKIRIDNADKTEGTFQTGNPLINGYESIDKHSGSANVKYAVGGRFIITIESTKAKSLDELKAIAASMDLDKLATM